MGFSSIEYRRIKCGIDLQMYKHNGPENLGLMILTWTNLCFTDSVQKFLEKQGWLLLRFFICLHDQLSSLNSVIVQMSGKRDSSNRQ